MPSLDETVEIGKGKVIQEGDKVCILNFGARLEECKLAINKLKAKGINPTLVDARFAKPLDEKLVLDCARNHEVFITIEEGSIGGFGSHVQQFLLENGVFDKGFKFRSMVLPDFFIDQSSPDDMYKQAGLNADNIEDLVLSLLGLENFKQANL